MNNPEQRQQKLIELYCLLVKRRKAEQAYDRAQWKVSYYRKAKTSKAYKNEPIKLAKKIEQVRLYALQMQKQLVEVKQRDSISMINTKNNLLASFLYGANGRITGIWLPDIDNKSKKGIELDMDRIFEIVDQHEADTSLTKALEDNNES